MNKKISDFFKLKNDFIELGESDIVTKSSKKSENRVTLFEHIKAITEKKYDPNYFNNLSESDKKTFSVYMINRYLSMHPYDYSWLFLINQFQKISYDVSIEVIYKLYSNIFPKGRVYLKYIKGKSEKKYNSELVDIISDYYKCSQRQSFEYLDIFYKILDGENKLIDICKMYAKSNDDIKKLLK